MYVRNWALVVFGGGINCKCARNVDEDYVPTWTDSVGGQDHCYLSLDVVAGEINKTAMAMVYLLGRRTCRDLHHSTGTGEYGSNCLKIVSGIL